MTSPTGGNWGPFLKPQQESLADIVSALGSLTISGGGGGTTQVFSGSGDPNGVITASPPAIYYDLTTPSSPIQWIKTTGTGNTGWV